MFHINTKGADHARSKASAYFIRSLHGQLSSLTQQMQYLNILESLGSWTVWFEPYLAVNPVHIFSCVEPHTIVIPFD